MTPLHITPAAAAGGVPGLCQTARVNPSRPGVVPPVDVLVRRLTGVPGREDRLRHLEVLPAREAVHEDWPAWVPDDVRGAFAA
jgi:DEAD/DEAH box helicase domain-containing protein